VRHITLPCKVECFQIEKANAIHPTAKAVGFLASLS